MAASFPTSIASFTTKTNGQTIQPAHINDLQAEITAIETALISGFPQTFIPLTDATYDLGSTSKKFRDLFLSRNALVGGTLGVTGATTLAALAATTGAFSSGVTAASGAFSGAVTAATYNAVLAIVAATAVATITAPAGQNAKLRISSPSTFSSALELLQASTLVWTIGHNVTGSTKALEFYNTTNAATMLSLTEAGGLGPTQNTAPITIASTTSVNNVAVTSDVMQISSAGGGPFTYTITGLVAPRSGNTAIVLVFNTDTNAVVLKHESGSSTAANRFTTDTGADITLATTEVAFCVYNSQTARWHAKKM